MNVGAALTIIGITLAMCGGIAYVAADINSDPKKKQAITFFIGVISFGIGIGLLTGGI